MLVSEDVTEERLGSVVQEIGAAPGEQNEAGDSGGCQENPA
jgi:hypothetical protein